MRLSLLLILLSACASTSSTSPSTPAASLSGHSITPQGFDNPGGMWMPEQIAQGHHPATLKRLGLSLDPAELTNPLSKTLSAIVSLGGCSASFVSADGLIATNHHCATGALQFNSSPKANYLNDGFLARSRAEELSNGPTARVFVTQKISDITKQMRAGLESEKDDLQRYLLLEERSKEITQACEAGRPDVRCTVQSFFERAEYRLTEQLEIKDVRLVWAPAEGIGNFGGEVDNWRWPRHSGDVTFFRAYVAPDGQSRAFHKDNVPYKPASFLKLASTHLKENDLVFMAGYPGRTQSLKSYSELVAAEGWAMPTEIAMCEEYLKEIDTLKDPAAVLVANPYVRRFNNFLTNRKGQLEGLGRAKVAAKRKETETAIRRDKAVAAALDSIDARVKAEEQTRVTDHLVSMEVRASRLLPVVIDLIRLAQERPKPDAERLPEYQARNWPRLKQQIESLDKMYHPDVDAVLVGTLLVRARRLDPQGPVYKAAASALGTAAPTDEALRAFATKLLKATRLNKTAERAKLFDATTKAFDADKDPMVAFARGLVPAAVAAEERGKRAAGRDALDKPVVMAALKALAPGGLAPDANGSLRITYGTVKGYVQPGTDKALPAFTKLSEMVAKHTGVEPFNVPEKALRAAMGKVDPRLIHPAVGEVPVNFVADLHITGGNSGSGTLNGRGELVGLAFDGNYEAIASDWAFLAGYTRSIHVDIHYARWLLQHVEEAAALQQELGIAPAATE